MSNDKSLFTLAFPTLVKDAHEREREDATVVQTRGPWNMDQPGAAPDDSVDGSSPPLDDEFDLPELPAQPSQPLSVREGRATPTPQPDPPVPMPATPGAARAVEPAAHGHTLPSALPPRHVEAPRTTTAGKSSAVRSTKAAPGAQASPAALRSEAPPADSFLSAQSSRGRDDLGPEEKKVIGGKYQVEARVGEGGMGRVYKVRHVDLGKTFALKIMRSVMADDEKMRQAFFREARLASSLSHPQIVSIIDFGQDPTFGVFMIMELLDGEPLKNLLKERGRIAQRAACDIMLQIADAVRYVHEKGIVHCDLKAENVLITTERSETGRRAYRAKLLDFGLARPHTGPGRSMTLSGTPAYIAPERIRGARPAPSMDIYALGILFYELLTGAPPFTGSLETVLYHHVNEPPPSPAKVMAAAGASPIDERVEAVILRALAKKPEDRPQSAGAFMYELRTAMEMLGFTTRRRTRSKPSPRAAPNDVVGGLFAECPLPLAVFGSDGTILLGNKAFSTFVCGEAVDLRGVAIAETSLLRACPTLRHDLRTVLSEGRTVQVGLSTPAADGTPTQLLLWLTPGPHDTDHVYCAIHVVGRL